jgi:hypothetical protein
MDLLRTFCQKLRSYLNPIGIIKEVLSEINGEFKKIEDTYWYLFKVLLNGIYQLKMTRFLEIENIVDFLDASAFVFE